MRRSLGWMSVTVAPRASTLREPLALGAGLVGCCAALAVWDPGDHGVPICPTKLLTGLDCPLCGGLRAAASIGRGHLVTAADHNLLVVAAVPVLVVWWLMWLVAASNGRPMPRWTIGRRGWWAIGLVAAVFTVVRNLHVAGLPHWLASGTA